MTAFRFLHSSDLHLGKRFGQMPEETRTALQQARQNILSRLADTARVHTVKHILIAGDLFDSETPSDRIWRQALAVMRGAEDLHWWIIPGNHDSAAAETLWAGLGAHAAPNTHLLLQSEPVQMAPGVYLLPAPCRHRFAGRDLTQWMDSCETPEGAVRIGLAHGGVLEFGSEEGGAEVISPQRAVSAGLDYLALGDWHGAFRLDARSRYSGAPEADRFKHAGRGQCLVVELPGAGAIPEVREVETGRYHWQEHLVSITPAANVATLLQAILPKDRTSWSQHLIRLKAEGWATPPQRLALQDWVREVAPEFCHFVLDDTNLRSEYNLEDLDLIATSGALRVAADELLRAAEDTSVTQEDRDIAAGALNRLFAYTQTEAGSEDALTGGTS